MKLELPLAILLLAIGGWLWIRHFPTMETAKTGPPHSDNGVAESAPLAGNNPIAESIPEFRSLQTASYGQPVLEQVPVLVSFEPGENDPGMMLAKSAKRLQMSPPIACKVRSLIRLFDQEIQGTGRYFQQGQGSGRTRLEMNYEISEQSTFESIQICDGKFHYWIQKLNGERQIEFVDLAELKSQRFDLSRGATQWLNRAGTVSLLKNLSSAFEFEEPVQTQLGGLDMLLLKGQWKPKAIESMLYGQVNPRNAEQGVEWKRLPGQIPHAVEVYLGADGFLPLFPYRLTFFRFDDSGGTLEKIPLMKMEFYEVQKIDQIPDTLFRVNADNSRQVDLSSSYTQRLEYMAESAAAAESQTLKH